MLTLVIFLIILGLLVFVHELGHFLAAQKAGVSVEEFGFGFPPRAKILGKKWGTVFTLNWIPFGGFVKIVGENYEENPADAKFSKAAERVSLVENFASAGFSKNLSFPQVSKKWQATILAAGVVFNIIFAWLLFSLGFMIGLPTSVENNFGSEVKDPKLTIVGVVSNSPAEKAGLKSGDQIKSISRSNDILADLNPVNFSDFINRSAESVQIDINRGGKNMDFEITPEMNNEIGRKIIGQTDLVGLVRLPIHRAFYEGGRTTLKISYLTTEGLISLISDAFLGKADASKVSGPVGLVGMVGDATRLGFAYLVTFTALISINLAIINLVPFPALDGGRIIFVAFEGLTRRKISPNTANILNTVGFFILIALMVFITYKDILKFF